MNVKLPIIGLSLALSTLSVQLLNAEDSLKKARATSVQEILDSDNDLESTDPRFNLPINEVRDAYDYYVVLEPKERAIISARIPARVMKIYKWLGESFEEGEVLMQLDDTVYKPAVIRGEALVAKSEALVQAKQKLFQDKIASYLDLKEAEAVLANAQSELALARQQYEACQVVGPYRGKVVSVGIMPNEFAQIGQPIIEILSDKVFIARLLVDSTMLNQIKIGKKIKIRVRETGEDLEAVISRIGSSIEPSSGTIKVEAEIENRNRTLISGMTGVTRLE